MLISERLKNLRLSHNMTQIGLAKLMSTTKQTIYKYEHDIIGNIPLERIEQYARIFHVTPAYICGWEENKKSILLDCWGKLNDEGRERLIEYADDLVQSKKYTECDLSKVV